ncbi:unnamed protein product [Durusdinium trenchii]|uniref:Tubulin--tyrosine ligase-like protein 9 n=1 Tax=Durusdinium trenchii TaxID=1381693 RepID=A0ABP0KN16_9DINO
MNRTLNRRLVGLFNLARLWRRLRRLGTWLAQGALRRAARSPLGELTASDTERLPLPKILGMDVILSKTSPGARGAPGAWPWLLEINRFPALGLRSETDADTKLPVIRDAWLVARSARGAHEHWCPESGVHFIHPLHQEDLSDLTKVCMQRDEMRNLPDMALDVIFQRVEQALHGQPIRSRRLAYADEDGDLCTLTVPGLLDALDLCSGLMLLRVMLDDDASAGWGAPVPLTGADLVSELLWRVKGLDLKVVWHRVGEEGLELLSQLQSHWQEES